MRKTFLLVCLLVVVAAACSPRTPTLSPDGATVGTAIPELDSNAETQTAMPFPSATPFTDGTTPLVETPAGSTPAETTSPITPQPQGETQFLAYIGNGQLLVTDVTNGVQGGTTQYTDPAQQSQVSDLAWSPSGEFVAFTASVGVDPHIFYVFAVGQGSPTDLGPGSHPAWSPDSRSIVYIGGAFPDNNIYVTSIDNPAPRQLTFESNFAWGNPVFSPDGTSLVVAGTSRDNLGASGNTSFTLESLALDGSGTRAPLSGATPLEGVRLPYDLRFSPDGSRLAFSTSFHLSACAAPGAYYVSSADGSNRQQFVSPSLAPAIDTSQEHYHVGLSYAWAPAGDAIVALGNVVDCNLTSPTPGQVIAGPQMSIIGLDGTERAVIPGYFFGLSMDRTGRLIAAARHEDGFQDLTPVIELYSAETGQLVLSLGEGSNPQFQP